MDRARVTPRSAGTTSQHTAASALEQCICVCGNVSATRASCSVTHKLQLSRCPPSSGVSLRSQTLVRSQPLGKVTLWSLPARRRRFPVTHPCSATVWREPGELCVNSMRVRVHLPGPTCLRLTPRPEETLNQANYHRLCHGNMQRKVSSPWRPSQSERPCACQRLYDNACATEYLL